MTDIQQKHVNAFNNFLKSFKEQNPEASAVNLTAFKKFTKLGKNRIRDSLKRAGIQVSTVMVPNFNKEGKQEGEVKQIQISL